MEHYGRGASDMKTGIAAFVSAIKKGNKLQDQIQKLCVLLQVMKKETL